MEKDVVFSIHGPMICGQAEAEKKLFKRVRGKSGRYWYIPVTDCPADNIYVSAHPDENMPGFKGFRGFGGAILTFHLVNGKKDEVQGPWHSNSTALLNDTGIDIRDQHLTQGIISTEREWTSFSDGLYKNVLYHDIKPSLGYFDRIDTLAQKYANKLNKIVYYAVKTAGGGSSGTKTPII